MIIQHNMTAETVNRNFKNVNKKLRNSMEKLSSGYRINKAADDAAGLSISEKMRGQIRGLNQAERNLEDGISLIQTAEGGMNEISSMIHRQRELVIQGMNGTNTDEDKEKIQMELEQLREGITEIAESTEFNTIPLLCVPTESETKTYLEPIYDTITVPVDDDEDDVINDFQTTLSVPPVNEFGGFLFSAVDKNGNKLNLVNITRFSFSAQSQSHIRVNGIAYSLFTLTTDQPTTLEDNTWVTTLGLRDRGVNLTIKQKVSIVDNPPKMAGQSFKIDYEVINNDSSTPVTFDFQFHIDTQLGSNDNAPFTVDDEEITHNTSYPRDDSMPGVVEVFDSIDNPNLNGVIITNSSGGMTFSPDSEPDVLNIGNYVDTARFGEGEEELISNIIDDSAYNLIWHNRTVANNSVTMTTYYGIKNPHPESPPRTEEIQVIIGYEEIKVVTETDPKLWIQSGANEKQGLWIHRYDCRADSLGLDYFSIDSIDEGEKSLNKLDEALKTLSSYRAIAGAEQNRLTYSKAYVESAAYQLSASESLIRDTNMAKEMMEYAKNNIIAQAAQSILTQANQQPQAILQLL